MTPAPARRLGLLTRHPQAVEGVMTRSHIPLAPCCGSLTKRLSDLMTVTTRDRGVLSVGWEVAGL